MQKQLASDTFTRGTVTIGGEVCSSQLDYIKDSGISSRLSPALLFIKSLMDKT